MPGSLARPPSHERIDRGSRRRTHRWARRGARRWPWRRNRRHSHGCGGEATIQWATVMAEQHSAHGQTAKHRTASGEDAGVADAIQPERRRIHHRRRREWGQKPQRDRARADRATGAISTGRCSEAMVTNGGETNESPRSNGRAWRGRANAPHGNDGAHRSSPELGNKVAGDSKSPERRGLGLERASGWERVRGRSTRPGWSGLARWGWPDQWAQAVSLFYLFLIAKILEKTLIWLKQTQKNI
jgi:hypothetical protein